MDASSPSRSSIVFLRLRPFPARGGILERSTFNSISDATRTRRRATAALHKHLVTAEGTLAVVQRNHVVNGALPLVILLLRIEETLRTPPEELLLAQHGHSLPVDVPVLGKVHQVHQRSVTRELRRIHHLSPAADGTVRVVCASPIVHRALIMMSFGTSPPDHLRGALRHVLRCQSLVSLKVPLRREVRTTGR